MIQTLENGHQDGEESKVITKVCVVLLEDVVKNTRADKRGVTPKMLVIS